MERVGRMAKCHLCSAEIDELQAYEWHGRYTKDGTFYHDYVCPKCMGEACLAHGLSLEAMVIHKEHCSGCSFCERSE